MSLSVNYFEKLKENLDAVEFCSVYTSKCFVASYQLCKETGIRNGEIFLYNQESNGALKFEESIDIKSGVLDLKFNSVGDLAVVALADGKVSLLKLNDSPDDVKFEVHNASSTTTKNDVLTLSVAWDKTLGKKFAASFSDGTLSMFSMENEHGNADEIMNIVAHDHEAWTVDFDSRNDFVLYSGGDDCRLKRTDFRESPTSSTTIARFDAGVTALQNHPVNENILLSGTYGDTVYAWDKRATKKWLCSTNVGGGVWRIKFCPKNSNLVAIAAMYDGAKILKFNQSWNFLECLDTPVEEVARFQQHESMCYGIEWSPIIDNNVVSCSFYDNALYSWTFDLPSE